MAGPFLFVNIELCFLRAASLPAWRSSERSFPASAGSAPASASLPSVQHAPRRLLRWLSPPRGRHALCRGRIARTLMKGDQPKQFGGLSTSVPHA